MGDEESTKKQPHIPMSAARQVKNE